MRITAMLTVALATLSGHVDAQSYDSYEAFYTVQPGSVFGAAIDRDADSNKSHAGVLYGYPGKSGYFAERHIALAQKVLDIEIWQTRIVVDGKIYRFARAAAYPGERASHIFPESAEVFTAAPTNAHPPLLCLEGHGSASGEASSRYRQIFLLVDPLARKPTFLHLPGLLSSCQAVIATRDGRLAFPKNSYLFDDVKEFRIGLLMSYYTFESQQFIPIKNDIRLRFTHPEIPFQFSVQNRD